MTSPVVVATDLDRTLIYSLNALGEGVSRADLDLLCVERLDGREISFLTARAADALRALADVAVLVPTTTRTLAQLARVLLPGVTPRFAVAANGGALLVDGAPDLDWSAAVASTLAASAEPLEAVWEHLDRVFDPAWTTALRRADDLFCYAVVLREALPMGFAEELARWAAARGWVTSLQGRKLYVVPRALTKGAAVSEIARRVGAVEVLAAGDSLLDAELLDLASRGIRPAHGELHESGWGADHIELTRAEGVLAGEEIAEWLLHTAAGGSDAFGHAGRRPGVGSGRGQPARLSR